MLLSFPFMHRELFTASVAGIRFFDPGMADEAGEDAFRPDSLPMDAKTAKALINDCINFGEQFKDPGEMAYFGAMTSDDFYEGSSMSIQAQLTRQFDDGQGGKEAREQKEAVSRAQFILLLAWFFEEKMMEVASIEMGVQNSWKAMDVTLGVDEEDKVDGRVLELGNVESHTGGASDGQSIPLPWQRILEALPAFIAPDTVLVCADSDIVAALDDMELAFAPADPGLGLPEGAEVVTGPAWQLAGRRKEPKGLPLALNDVTVAVIR